MDLPIGYEDEYTDETRIVSCAYFLLNEAKDNEAKYKILTQMMDKIKNLVRKETP